MIGQITDFYSSGYGSALSQSNGFYAPSSVKSDVVPPTKTSAKAIYEQRKNHARDSISNISDTSQYHVEHLTTFVIDRKDAVLTVEDGIRKLKLMDAKGKIWTQDMILQVQDRGVNLYDVESKNELENFPVSTIQHCQAMMNTCRYNSILALVCKEPTQSKADLHLFQCDEVKASLIQHDIEYAVRDSKGGKHRKRPDALRAMRTENKVPPPPVAPAPVPPGSVTQVDVRSRVSAWSSWASEYGDYESLQLNYNLDETPEMAAGRIDRDVQILNHILDDIEFFIMKLQKAAEAYRQLSKRKKYKRSYKPGPGEGLLTLRAQPPPHEEFIDCFQKFKHGMNLLAKLRSHIRNPTASELVHFLFTPLKMMVEATGGPALASTILSPLLIKDALDFLQFILNMEEKAFWASLGDTWNKSRAEWPKDQFIPPYIPRFRNGWEPPSLTFVGIPKEQQLNYVAEPVGIVSELQRKPEINKLMEYSSIREYPPSEGNPQASSNKQPKEFALCKYDFVARNSSELSVMKDDILEVIDDKKQWWKVRNSNGITGFVPNNIMGIVKTQDQGPSRADPQETPYSQTIQKQRLEYHSKQAPPESAATSAVPDPPPTPAPLPAPPFNPVPATVPYSSRQKNCQSPISSDSGGNSLPDHQGFIPISTDRRKSQMEEVQDELVHRLTIGRTAAQRKFTVPRQNVPAVNITYSSSAEDVRAWLEAKGFSPVTITSLGVLTGEQILSLTKDELKTVCPEGPRVYNQVAVQKMALEELHGTSELQEIMKKRQEKISALASDSGVESFDEGNSR